MPLASDPNAPLDDVALIGEGFGFFVLDKKSAA